MDREINSLLLKSNRVLGTRLIEAGLTTMENLDSANGIFVQRVRERDIKRASLLRILVYEQQTLREEELLDYQIEHFSLGGITLDGYKIDDAHLKAFASDLLRVTWTVPIEVKEDHWFLASSYYLSDIVREFWTSRLEGEITWLLCNLGQVENHLDELEASAILTEKQKS